MDCGPPGSSAHGFLQARVLEWMPAPSPGDFPDPGIEPRSPALQADSLPSELPGKPKNTGMDSLSRLQGNFPTQESNWDLLHCSWFLYQLSYSGSPTSTYNTMLNRNDGSGHSYLALEFRGDTFSFSLLSVMLPIGLSYMIFIILRDVPSTSTV